MQFTVFFETGSSVTAAFFGSQPIGINDVDIIREKLGISLPLDRIKPRNETLQSFDSIVLSEETARESGLYKDKSHVGVRVPQKMLNQFCDKVAKCTTDEQTGEVLSAWIEYRIDKDAVIEAWRQSGFRTEWDIQIDNSLTDNN